MPWCPSCESEYDDHVKRCKQCDVDLVEDLQSVVRYEKLVEMDESEVRGAIEYLKYSGIEDVKTQVIEDHVELLVPVQFAKEALKQIRVYFYNLEKERAQDEPDDAEQLPKEYETDTKRDGAKVKEMHSSATSFIGIGGLLLGFALLNLIGVLSVIEPSLYLYGIILLSISFLIIGILTLKKIPTYEAEISERDVTIQQMVTWYTEGHSVEHFYENNQINPSQFDEGALYFVAIDVIKAKLKEQFDTSEEVMINSAAEEVFSKVQ